MPKPQQHRLDFFFLAKPPKVSLPIPHFRTLGDKVVPRPSPDLIETVHTMERRQTWIREYLINEGEDPLLFVGSAKLTDKPESIAENILATLQLDACWAAEQSTWADALSELRSRMERVRILVAVNGVVGNNNHRKLSVDEFRGFVLVDKYAPLVFINNADSKAAQMFTIAHELAHVWLGISAAFDLREMLPADDKVELLCNLVAAEFLVPEKKMRSAWVSVSNNSEPFDVIAKKFKVSQLVAARRALDLGLINKKTFHEFYERYMAIERTAPRGKGGNFYASQNQKIGQYFGETLIRAVREGSLLYRDAYRLTGLYGKTFDEFVNNVKGVQ